MGNGTQSWSSKQHWGNITGSWSYSSPSLADHPLHAADAVADQHVVDPPERGRSACCTLAQLPPFPPWRGKTHKGNLGIKCHNVQSSCYFSLCPTQEAKGRSYSFAHQLLALPLSLHEDNWKAGWTRELVMSDKMLFKHHMCFWSVFPGQHCRAAIAAEQDCLFHFYVLLVTQRQLIVPVL